MNSFSPSGRMRAVVMPPIAEIMGRISDMRSRGRKVFGMAQAVPWYSPPEEALRELSSMLGDPAIHSYSPDPGFPGTRKAVAEDFRLRRGIDLDPSIELHLTCGASQAFLSALLAVSSAGDRVAVLEPYYFDHVFAIRFCDLEPVFVPMREVSGGWEIPVDRLAEEMSRLKALVVVNPGNPTGSVIPDGTMKELVRMTASNGVFLLIDETYERFVFTGDGWHPWMERRQENVLTLGSFSKSLGMPGWRLGYLFGPEELMHQAIKVQDSVVICPPAPAQRLLELLIDRRDWINRMSEGVKRRLVRCREALSANPCLHWREAGGAFFTLAAYEGGIPSRDAALHLLSEYGIGSIPGSAFGPSGEEHLRISFGCLSEDDIEPAMEILSGVSFPP